MATNKVVEFAERMQAWHQARTQQARGIQEVVEAGTTIKLQGDSPSKVVDVELTEREANVFRMGMEAALACFDKLPFEMHRKAADDTEQEDSHV